MVEDLLLLRPEPDLPRVRQCVAEREVVVCGESRDVRLGHRADAPLRLVEDATNRHLVGGVDHGDEVRERVLDLGTVVELGAAHDPVRDRRADEDLLQCSRLRVRAVEHGDVVVADTAGAERLDLIGDELRLVVLRVPGEADDRVPCALVSPQLLVFAIEVVADDRVRRVEDVLTRPVVLFEEHDPRAGEVALELGDVADVGAAEGVNRLVGISHHREGGTRLGRIRHQRDHSVADVDAVARGRLRQLADELVLRVVRVLVLVDEDVPEAPPVHVGDLRKRPEQIDRLREQIVEIERVRLAQSARVVLEDLDEDPFSWIRHVRLTRVRVGILQLVLQHRDPRLCRRRRETVGVSLMLFHQPLHEGPDIARVVDRECFGEAELLGLATQDAHARRVERRDPHPLRLLTHELLDTLAHLARGLVRERDREDLAWPGLAGTQQ